MILRAKPSVLVYVSCNPATQARDLALLDHDYKVTDIQPVDMFPHTHHVEKWCAFNSEIFKSGLITINQD